MIRNEKKSNRPDEALARLAANGNAAAFDEIYSRHRSFVYNVALRMTGNAADAEDLTQESFVSVLRRVGSFRGEASLTTWLYRIVINQVKMHFRYRSSRPEIQMSDGEIPEPWLAMARCTDPGEQLIDGLAIEKAMLTLPPGYRTAFILHDIEGYKHGEAARLSGHAVGTSKSQLHKARASLRAVLVHTQAKARAKREAQQRIVEMMLPEEALEAIRLQRRDPPECWAVMRKTKIVSSASNGVFWCHGKCGERR